MGSTHNGRFNLGPDELDDMACGVNGRPFEQWFRPAYVTAQWTDGALVKVQIWGQRLLKDGSLGKRTLDHHWKRTDAGPVRYSDLPSNVASRLRSYAAESGFEVAPE